MSELRLLTGGGGASGSSGEFFYAKELMQGVGGGPLPQGTEQHRMSNILEGAALSVAAASEFGGILSEAELVTASAHLHVAPQGQPLDTASSAALPQGLLLAGASSALPTPALPPLQQQVLAALPATAGSAAAAGGSGRRAALVAMRHSVRADMNAQGIFLPAAECGDWPGKAERPWDPPIINFELPRVRMREVAAALEAAGCAPITRIVSSPYRRTLQTASECARVLGLSEVTVSSDFARCGEKTVDKDGVPHTFMDFSTALGDGITPRISGYAHHQWNEDASSSLVRLERALRAELMATSELAGSMLVIGHGSLIQLSGSIASLYCDSRVCCTWLALSWSSFDSSLMCVASGGGASPEAYGADFLRTVRAQIDAFVEGDEAQLALADLTDKQRHAVHCIVNHQ